MTLDGKQQVPAEVRQRARAAALVRWSREDGKAEQRKRAGPASSNGKTRSTRTGNCRPTNDTGERNGYRTLIWRACRPLLPKPGASSAKRPKPSPLSERHDRLEAATGR